MILHGKCLFTAMQITESSVSAAHQEVFRSIFTLSSAVPIHLVAGSHTTCCAGNPPWNCFALD